MFDDLDEDHSGALSMDEFLECLDDFAFVRKMKTLDIDLEDLPDIFEILDDGDGQVDQEEFIGGMIKMQGNAGSGEMLKATCMMSAQNVHFSLLEDAFVQNAMEVFRGVEGSVDRLHENMNDIIQLSAEVVHKLNHIGIRKVVGGSANQMPFMEDPTIDDVMKAEKSASKKRRKRRDEYERAEKEADLAGRDVRELIPEICKELDAEAEERKGLHAHPDKLVPVEWILRNGKSPLTKNPGKLRLHYDPKLKDKLLGAKPKKKPKWVEPSGFYKELGRTWERLDLPITRDLHTLDLTIETKGLNYGSLPKPPPRSANGLVPWMIAPSPKSAAAPKKIDPLASMGLAKATPTPKAAGVEEAATVPPGSKAALANVSAAEGLAQGALMRHQPGDKEKDAPASKEGVLKQAARLGVGLKKNVHASDGPPAKAAGTAPKDGMSLTPQVAKASAQAPAAHPHAVP